MQFELELSKNAALKPCCASSGQNEKTATMGGVPVSTWTGLLSAAARASSACVAVKTLCATVQRRTKQGISHHHNERQVQGAEMCHLPIRAAICFRTTGLPSIAKACQCLRGKNVVREDVDHQQDQEGWASVAIASRFSVLNRLGFWHPDSPAAEIFVDMDAASHLPNTTLL